MGTAAGRARRGRPSRDDDREGDVVGHLGVAGVGSAEVVRLDLKRAGRHWLTAENGNTNKSSPLEAPSSGEATAWLATTGTPDDGVKQ